MRACSVICLLLVSAAAALPQGGVRPGPPRSRLTSMVDNMMGDVGSIADRIRTGFRRTMASANQVVSRPQGAPAVRAAPGGNSLSRQQTAPNAPPFRRPQQQAGVGTSIRRAFNRVADGMRNVVSGLRPSRPGPVRQPLPLQR